MRQDRKRVFRTTHFICQIGGGSGLPELVVSRNILYAPDRRVQFFVVYKKEYE